MSNRACRSLLHLSGWGTEQAESAAQVISAALTRSAGGAGLGRTVKSHLPCLCQKLLPWYKVLQK